jgi:hypothetical protein
MDVSERFDAGETVGMNYMAEQIKRLTGGWKSPKYKASGEGKVLEAVMGKAGYKVWKASPDKVKDPKVVLVGSVSPMPDNARMLREAFRGLQGMGAIGPADVVIADEYVKALPEILESLGIPYEFDRDDENWLLSFTDQLERYRAALTRYVEMEGADPKLAFPATLEEKRATFCEDFKLKEYEASMLASMELRTSQSMLPSITGANGKRVYHPMEFFHMLSGGSKGFEKSVFPEIRNDREPTIFRELEKAGISYVAFMPEKVELGGALDVTLHPRGGFE